MNAPKLHFSHANGFPSRCYEPIFERLGMEVTFVDKTGHGEFSPRGHFDHVVEELIQEVERCHQEPVIGMGHSTGGVLTLLAAARRPELFSRFVILDPVLFHGPKRYAIKILQRSGLAKHIGPARLSKKRRTRFKSLDQVRRAYGRKALFRDFHPECFESYLKHGFVPSDDGGVELAFSSEVETELFCNVQASLPKAVYGLKGLMLYGDNSNIFDALDARWWRRAFPHFRVEAFRGGHLFPFEDPDSLAELVLDYLDSSN